jgi:hypothetical protein
VEIIFCEGVSKFLSQSSDFYYAAVRYLFTKFDHRTGWGMSVGRRVSSEDRTSFFSCHHLTAVFRFVSAVGLYRWDTSGLARRCVWDTSYRTENSFSPRRSCRVYTRWKAFEVWTPSFLLDQNILTNRTTSSRLAFTFIAELIFGMMHPKVSI